MSETGPATTSTPMFTIAHARVAQGTPWRQALAACIERLGPVPAGANLGFLYATDAFAADLPAIVEALKERSGIRDWVGSIGVGIAAADQEYFDEPALALMVAALPPSAFRLIDNFGGAERDADSALARAAVWAKDQGPTVSVVHADPRNPRLTGLVEGLAEATSGFLVGGLTSSRGAIEQVAGKVVEGGISGVMLANSIAIATGLSQGCSPIGPSRTITAAERNVAFEIDGRRALDVLREDIGDVLSRRLERLGDYIHAALPVVGSDTGDYLVRNLAGIDTQRGWVAIGELIAAGDQIMFVRRDREAAEADLVRMLARLKRRAPAAPKGGLYFSCVARGPNLFGPGSAELAILRRELGAFPLVGMFCNGEISNNRLYGYTGVLALFL